MYESEPPVAIPPAVRSILPIERLAALVEVILCSGLPTMLMIGAVVAGFGVSPATPDGGLSGRFVILVSLIDTVVVTSLVLLLLRAHQESARDVLVGRGRVLREAALGVALVPAVFILVVMVLGIVLHYAPFLRNVPVNPLEALIRTRGDAIVFGFVAMVAGGVREEVVRGFIIHRFDGYLGGGLLGVILYGALFGLGHFEQGWDASIATGCLGLIWGLVYLRRRSIVAPVVSHAGFNLAQIVKAIALR